MQVSFVILEHSLTLMLKFIGISHQIGIRTTHTVNSLCIAKYSIIACITDRACLTAKT